MAGEVLDDVEAQLNKLGNRVGRLETTAREVSAGVEQRTRSREIAAEEASHSDRREKQLLGQWLNGFVYRLPTAAGPGADLSLDAIDFAFVRYALNVAVAAPHAQQDKLIIAGVPQFLVGIVDRATRAMVHSEHVFNNSEKLAADVSRCRRRGDVASLLAGPALLALAHVCFADGPARAAVVAARGIPVLLQCITVARQPAVLSHACRVVAAVALVPAHRIVFAAENALGALCDLLRKALPPPLNRGSGGDGAATPPKPPESFQGARVTESVQCAALQAITNITFHSEVNRKLLADVGGVEPIVACCLYARDGAVVRDCAKALGNLCFASPFGSTICLGGSADAALCLAVGAADLLAEDAMLPPIFQTLANLCSNESGRTGLAAGDAMQSCIRAAMHGRHADVVRNALRCTAALAFDHLANKSRLADMGALRAATRVVADYGFGGVDRTEAWNDAVLAACRTAASLLRYKPTHPHFWSCGGVPEFARLALQTQHMDTLTEAAMVLASVAPKPWDRKEARQEGRLLGFDGTDGLKGMLRCKRWNFGVSGCPEWLDAAIDSLQLSEDELDRLPTCVSMERLREFFPETVLFEEASADVDLDHIVTNSKALHALALRLY
ncbi:armadillo-type protein [Pelagophyceae sp. CCMP2097]|nr:armadillo-type protein [Pelagophyceae sp. CCMP2097]